MSLYDDASLIMYPSGYKSGKIYSQKPTDGTGDLTFTRASTATRVNPSGLIESVATGVPRIDYLNGCGQLLLEPQKTNRITESANFSTWTNIEDTTLTSAAATSPTGAVNAYSLIANNVSNFHRITTTYTLTSGLNYSASVFIKANGHNFFLLRLSTIGGANRNVCFNLSNATVDYLSAAIISAEVKSYGNGWYRCSCTWLSDLSSMSIFMRSQPTTQVGVNDGINNYVGDNTSGAYIFGAQVEEGSYPTSYIPTAGSTVTRVVDESSTTGLSSVIGQTEGSLIVDITFKSFTGSNYTYIQINDGTTTNFIELYQNSVGNIIMRINDNGGGATNIDMFSGVVGVQYKIGITYSDGACKMCVNGGSVSSAAINFNNSVLYNNLVFNKANYIIRQLQLYPSILSNAQLIALTTI